jgi:hypothetical protein
MQRGLGQAKMAVMEEIVRKKTKIHFQFRIDLWDANAGEILAHVAGSNDLEVAEAAYQAALKRWPTSRVILRQGARTVQDSGPRSVIA